MPTCSRYFQCTFHVFLSFHIGKIQLRSALAGIKLFTCIDLYWFKLLFPIEELNHFFQIFHSIYFQVVYNSCFTRILFRNDDAFKAQLPCFYGNWQSTFDRL